MDLLFLLLYDVCCSMCVFIAVSVDVLDWTPDIGQGGTTPVYTNSRLYNRSK